MTPVNPTHIAIFASGTGTNARQIIEYFADRKDIKVVLVVSNKPEAGVLQIAAERQIPSLLIEKERFFRGDAYLPELEHFQVNFIVLAGFLWKIPLSLVQHFSGRMINIHPALLPLYGGKGMYGQKVHAAVLEAGDRESGITIHFVTEGYDEGGIVFQAKCPVLPGDNPETLAQRIHQLEHSHFPRIIEEVIHQKRVG